MIKGGNGIKGTESNNKRGHITKKERDRERRQRERVTQKGERKDGRYRQEREKRNDFIKGIKERIITVF